MRSKVKFRLLFLSLALICFWLGVSFTPDTLNTAADKWLLGGISAVYFILLPIGYWYCIIKIGQQKLWKLIMIFSLSSLVARLSYPAELSHYFEFVMWLRYPIIAVLLLIELYLVISVIRGLLKARTLKGDPRVGAVETYNEGAEKTLTVALILASEATNWYYSIPWFSRQHPATIAHINLLSARRWHVWLMVLGCIGASTMSYMLLQSWSEIIAIIVASFISYTLMAIVANHRISRHYSLYFLRNKLVINNGLWGFMVIDSCDISQVNQQQASVVHKDDDAVLSIGRGQSHVSLVLNKPVIYHGGMGQLPEPMSEIHLSVDKPEDVIAAIEASRIEASHTVVAA
ncbi:MULTISPECIES: hypothetical protein [Pseudomonadati]|uniref:PH domain-containing protein n=1 Tax=Shewanella aestuarii TaxID=1028752 RepID=A0ABT0KYL7_9GAMM|nr:hypothetical protein [Shewanella aestuarii]MCL1116541.1 hypothetical protein [Shewanella aestuarii]GGN72008.1 hypothetical protein GCM10009193_08470 [Shewanella aestuarii]